MEKRNERHIEYSISELKKDNLENKSIKDINESKRLLKEFPIVNIMNILKKSPLNIRKFMDTKYDGESEIKYQEILNQSFLYIKKNIEKNIISSEFKNETDKKKEEEMDNEIIDINKDLIQKIRTLGLYYREKNILERFHKIMTNIHRKDTDRVSLGLFLLKYIDKDIEIEKNNKSTIYDKKFDFEKSNPRTIMYRHILNDIENYLKNKKFKNSLNFRKSAGDILAKDITLYEGE